MLLLFAWRQRDELPQRLRLALHATGAFLIAQMILGISNVWTGITPYGSLTHQGMGMCLFMALVLSWFDAWREPGVTVQVSAKNRVLGSVLS